MLYAATVWAQPPVPAQGPAAPAGQQAAAQRPTSTADQVMGFERRCAICHDNPGPDSRAPSREALRQLTPERVLAALTTGSMVVPGDGDERRAEEGDGRAGDGQTVRWTRRLGTAASMKNRCDAPLALQNPWTQPRWNGWSPDSTNGLAIPARRSRRLHRRAGAAAEAEVGVRDARRRLGGVGAADRRRRRAVHRQRQRIRLRARRPLRLRALVLRGARARCDRPS